MKKQNLLNTAPLQLDRQENKSGVSKDLARLVR